MEIKFKKINPDIGGKLPGPGYATPGSAGIDLVASLEQPVTVAPRARVIIPTGLAVDIPTDDLVGLVFPRSGLSSRHGIALANAVGVIDSDYKGEIKCPVQNNSDEAYVIRPGDRIAQLLFIPIQRIEISFTNDMTDSQRGIKGFGSTGR